MLKRFVVDGLFGHQHHELDFHPDLNILTGKNGSGKTTLLKLFWYLLSGKLRRIAREIPCDSAELITDGFGIKIALSKGRLVIAMCVSGPLNSRRTAN